MCAPCIGKKNSLEHFHFLLNAIIADHNLSSLEELNTVWACILHKGHGKDKESDRSYRTISVCPILAKALDMYAGNLYSSGWSQVQAETQFQGPDSSHELAALLLSETINITLYQKKQPLYVLFLDAQSAFDKILRENVIIEAFKAGTVDQGLLYFNNRLGNRRTYCEWNKELAGPILDNMGVEQGGINSDRLYKLANNNQLKVAQSSQLGAHIGSMTVSCIGQADDSCLIASSLSELQCLLLLTEEYCREYFVTLVPEKIKLLAYVPSGHEESVNYSKQTSPICINGQPIPFVDTAEHVGIVRSTSAGNMPNILARLSAHKKAYFALLPAGLAKANNGNPAASIRAERLFATPVLLSGLASLVLSKTEISFLATPYKQHMERLLKLHRGTPPCVIWFLAGCLPFEATLHLRQISLLGMISRLNDGINPLASHARHVYATAKTSSKSWFLMIQQTFLLYDLPHPIKFLDCPISKSAFKRTTRSAVLDYWNKKLRKDASELSSLPFFHPSFMSLTKTHPLYLTCGSSPFECSKAVVQGRYLSGRARLENLTKYWDPTNKEGYCLLCKPHSGNPHLASLAHMLLPGGCEMLCDARLFMFEFINSYLVPRPHLFELLKTCLGDDNTFVQFMLDCSTIPEVIKFRQETGSDEILDSLFYISRTYVYKLHIVRKRILGL